MWFGKRTFDILFSLFGLIIFSWLFLLISIIIVIVNPGPIFYRQQRIGKNMMPFNILKFRTMIVDADKKGLLVTAQNDPRITSIGKILRKTKLDEMPQFWNVLIGEMSFVGPRPEVQKYVEHIPEEQRKKIFSLKPGITDLASLYYRDEEVLLAQAENPEQTYIEKILPHKTELALKYLAENSCFADIKIIISTIFKVVQKS